MRAPCGGWRVSCIGLVAAISAGCSSSVAGGLADPVQRLETLTGTDRRVGLVFERLIVANVALCSATAPMAGWILHAASPYSRTLRPLAEIHYGLRGDLPGILAVAPGSPAVEAGLAPGDLITGVNGAALPDGGASQEARHAGFAQNLERLARGLAVGHMEITVVRDHTDLDLMIEPRNACDYAVQVDPSALLNAKADGRRVYITTGMAGEATSDDELAMILSHELAHNILRHDQNASALMLLPWRGAVAERDADRLGLYLVARAGFSVDAAVEFWRRYGEAHWWSRQAQWGHPSTPERYRTLIGVREEIAHIRDQGSDLVPADLVGHQE